MRFRLVTLFVIITVLAAFCGIVFAAPLWLTAITLAVTMWLSPAVWVSGWSYAKGGRQAFFRGGLVCGTLPFIVASWAMVLGLAFGSSASISIYELGDETAEDALMLRITYVAIWLAPGIFSILGGSISYFTYRLLSPGVARYEARKRGLRPKRLQRPVKPRADEQQHLAEGGERPLPR